MSKQYFTSRWLIGLSLLITLSALSTAWSQTALERLENQIRQRVGQEPQPPPPQAGITSPMSANAGTEPAASVAPAPWAATSGPWLKAAGDSSVLTI